MALYKIDKSVPIPEKNGMDTTRLRKYPWFEMKKGDSFFVPKKPIGYVQQAIGKITKTHKRVGSFTCRKEGDGVRCWKTG